VPAGRVAQRAGGGIEHGQGQGGRAQRGRPRGKGVGALEHLGDVGFGDQQLVEHGA